MAARGVLLGRRHVNQHLRGGAPDAALGLFAGGEDGFYFDYAKTDRTFQDTDSTPADDDAEAVALAMDEHAWSGKTLPVITAEQTDLSTPFVPAGTGWAVVGADSTHIVTFGTGSLRYQSDTSSPVLTVTRSGVSVVIGRVYEIKVACTAWVSGSIKLNGGSWDGVILADGIGTKTIRARTSSGAFSFTRSGPNVDLTLGSITVREIPGRHGVIAGSARPVRKTGGFLRFDGSDDNLLTTLNPTAAFTMAFKGLLTASSQLALGSTAGGATRCFIGTNSAGVFSAGVGADDTLSITGGNIVNALTVGVVTFDGTTVRLYRNGPQVFTKAQNGVPNTTIPLRVGAMNSNGTANNFVAGDLHKALAIARAITADEVAAITTQWGTT